MKQYQLYEVEGDESVITQSSHEPWNLVVCDGDEFLKSSSFPTYERAMREATVIRRKVALAKADRKVKGEIEFFYTWADCEHEMDHDAVRLGSVEYMEITLDIRTVPLQGKV